MHKLPSADERMYNDALVPSPVRSYSRNRRARRKGVKNQKQKKKKKRRCWTQQTNMILRISFTNLTYFYLHVRVRARTKCVSIIL